jgi:3-deoxy-D-manno-octulosonate 8-phosphate phosphatase (KDO 8-P phosphatase)
MTGSAAHQQSLKQIRAVALDVDGVLTDGGLWWGANGEEWKRFCFRDIMGLSLARRAGLKLALISGEDSPLVDRYAEKMMIRHVVKACRNKAAALKEFASAAGLSLREVCFMGDDINDLPAMQIAGLSSAPANAARDVLSIAQFVAKSAGGEGAVRELIEAILDAQGLDLQEILATK